MANVTVTYQVTMGFHHTCASKERIGTDGCAPCVGIIAVVNAGNTVFCGHMCDPAKKNVHLDQEKLKAIFEAYIPPATVVKIGYVSNFNQTVEAALVDLYAGKVDKHPKFVTRQVGPRRVQVQLPFSPNGMYWDGNKIGYVSGNDEVKGWEWGRKGHEFVYR